MEYKASLKTKDLIKGESMHTDREKQNKAMTDVLKHKRKIPLTAFVHNRATVQ